MPGFATRNEVRRMSLSSLGREDRLLVVAPHPDDESLACGGLIRRARSLGVETDIVFVTDGDNNPWPQRLAERRWRLDAGAGRRWGAMRDHEAERALECLGVPANAIEFLHWRDQGVTGLMIADPMRMIERIAESLARIRPTIVVCPSVFDTHPDHSAAGLLFASALRRDTRPCAFYFYRVHGPSHAAEGAVTRLVLDNGEFERKRKAVLCHASQTLFGRRRLLRLARPFEEYLERDWAATPRDGSWRWQFRSDMPTTLKRCQRLLLFGMAMSGEARSAEIDLRDPVAGDRLRLVSGDNRTIEVEMAPRWQDMAWLVAKLDHLHRINTYDLFTWNEVMPCRSAFK
jgi:N-acetyl-1-D-myo-inositol-2-amino-2-deoxy-alpha-D-glucopyranoside deacetylase